MSLFDYQISKDIAEKDYSFYALLMATMRQADSDNTIMLKQCWPGIWKELQARYNAPGGILDGE